MLIVEQVTHNILVIVQEEGEPVPPHFPTLEHVKVVEAVFAKVVGVSVIVHVLSNRLANDSQSARVLE